MHPVTRVFAAAVLTGATASGALALRPASATAPLSRPAESSAQSVAVADAHLAQARRAEQALLASRRLAAARHTAYLRSQAVLAARARAVTAARTTPPAEAARRLTASPPSYLARGQAALASLHYDVAALGYRVVFRPGSAGLLGVTDSGSRTITVYVRSSESDLVLRHTIAHEIGHALDFTRGTAASRLQYLAIRGLSSRLEWFGCSSCTDYRTPAGDWAEVFGAWLAGPGDFRSQLGGAPTSAQLARLAPLFRAA